MIKVRTKRLPFEKDILINGEIMVRGIDIGEGGLYVHTGRSNIPGQVVEVEIPFMGGSLKVNAKVKHSQEGVGMGLMFVNLTPGQKKDISELLKSVGEEADGGTGATRDIEKKREVLLVDDNLSTQRIYKSRLILEGFSVTTADDGLAAIKALKKNPSGTDLVVLDLYMDKVDGFKVLSLLKKTPELQDVPVVILSSLNSTNIMNKAIERGAARYLPKMQTSPSRLAETINEILQHENKKGLKKNCWEFMKCGRAPGGEYIKEWGLCPASHEERLNGVHGGVNAGRACWAVMGTMCGGKIQSTFAQKYKNCVNCPFFKSLRDEEGENYQDTMFLLNLIDQ